MNARKLLSIIFLLAWTVTALAAAQPERVYVISPDEVRAIDDETFTLIEKTVQLPGERIITWWNTLDQKRLALVTQKGLIRFKQPAKLVVIDLESMKIINTTELSMHPVATVRSESGRRGYVLHYGKEKKDILPTLLAVDAVEGKVTASLTLDERPAYILLSADEDRVGLIYYGTHSLKLKKRTHARYEVVDAVTLEPVKLLDLPGPVTRVTVNNIQQLAYLMDPGIDKKKIEKSLPGRLYVLDPGKAELVADLELGTAPGFLSWDAVTERYYVLTRPKKSKTATALLETIERDKITGRLELPVIPTAVTPSPDRDRFYILEGKAIRIADGDLSGLGQRMELERVAGGLLQHEDTDIGYVLHPASNHVTRVNLGGEMSVLSSFMTGRTSARVKKGLAVAAAIVLSAAANAYMAQSSPYYYNNQYYYYYNPVIVPYGGYTGPKTSGWYSEDGRYAYLFNTGTNDVTIYDNKRNDVVKMIPGGAYGIRFVHDNQRLVTLTAKKLRVFDVGSHQMLFETKYPGIQVPSGFDVHPDDVHGYIYSGRTDLLLIDMDKGKEVKTFPNTRGQLIRLRKPDDFVPHEGYGWN
jgi:hypothetical protein